MGFLNHLLGNATEINLSELKGELDTILAQDEELVAGFKIFRDKWIFTSKRLIMIDVQGLTGSKREYHSLPYKSITHFSFETAGTFDDDSEMKIWISGTPQPFVKEFSRGVDIKGISKTFATLVLGGR